MKQTKQLSRSRWLLLTLLSLLMTLGGTSPAWAYDILSEGFESNSLSTNGWTTSNPGSSAISTDAKKTGSYGYKFYYYSSGGPRYLISPVLNIPANATNTKLSFFYKNYASYGTPTETFRVGTSTTDNSTASFSWSEDITINTKTWTEFEQNLDNNVKYIAIQYKSGDQYYLYIDDINITCGINGPALSVSDGTTNIASGYNYSFGLATAGTTKTFTLSNPGTEATPISVSHTGSFGVAISENATSIPAGESVTLTVTMPDATGNDEITISSSTNGIEDFTINVSGTVRDPNKLWCNFSSGLPTGWDNAGGWDILDTGADGITTGGGYARNTTYGTNKRFFTPLLTIAEGEKLYLKVKGHGSTASWNKLYIQYSANGTEWTNAKSLESITNVWQDVEVTEIPAGNWYIGFYGSYVYITDIYGGTESTAPVLSLSQSSYDFGLINENTTSSTITVTNTGKSDLTGMNLVSSNAAFTFNVTDDANTIAANGGTATFTVTMSSANAGAQNGIITIQSDNADDLVLNVSGAVMKAGTTTETFNNNQKPERWTNSSDTYYYWNFSDGKASAGSGSQYSNYAYMITPKMTVSADDFLAIKIKAQNSNYGFLKVYTSTDGTFGSTPVKEISYSELSTSDYKTIIVNGLTSEVKYFKFEGYYVTLDEIAGLTYAPVLVVKDAEDAVQASPVAYAFDEQGANASVTYSFTNGGAGTLNITNVAVTNDPDDGTYTTNWTESVAAPFDLVITQNYDAEKAGAKTGSVVVTCDDGSTFTINLTGTTIGANQPKMDFYIDEEGEKNVSGDDLGFGIITDDAVKQFTIKNDGTGALNITGITLPDADYTTDLETAPSAGTPLVIAAGSKKVIKITLAATAKAIKTGNITISAEGMEDFSFKADAYVLKGTETATFTSIPDGWDKGTWNLDGTNNDLYTNSSTKPYLTTAKLACVANDFIVVTAKKYDNDSGDYIQIQYSTDNGENWTDLIKLDDSTLPTRDAGYNEILVNNIPEGTNKLRFQGYYARIKQIAGLTYDANDPQLAVFSDAEATEAVVSGTAKDLGWVTADATATYYIKNAGTGTLTISNISNVDGFTTATTNNAMTIAAGADPLALTVTMAAENNEGYHNGTITVTTDGGNFEIPVSGVVRNAEKNFIDFATAEAAVPTGWTANSWTVTQGANGYIYSGTSVNELITSTMIAGTGGEKLIISASGNKSDYWNPASLMVYTKTGDNDWSEATDLTNQLVSTSNWYVLEVDIPEGENLIKFEGKNAYIQRIYGLTAKTEPFMELDYTEAAYNFGIQTAAANKELVITNSGNADLEGVTAALTGEDAADYEVALSIPDGSTATITENVATVPAGQTLKVTATLKASKEYKTHTATLTISSTSEGIDDKVITLTGKTRDADKQYIDFADGVPATWTNSDAWTASSGYVYTSGQKTLRMLPISLEANEKLYIDARLTNNQGGSLTARYTTNNGVSWKEYVIPAVYNYNEFSTYAIDLGNSENAATAFVEFVGTSAAIDNIYGGTATTAPLLEVTHEGNAVTTGDNFDFGSNLQAAPAAKVFTLANKGNAEMTAAIAATGDVTVTPANATIAAGESTDITVNMPYNQENVGDKTGAVTITFGGNTFTLNFTGNTIDPTALSEDLASLPAGWYNGGWTVNGSAYINSGVEKELITEQYTAEAGKNVLSFKAKAQNGNEGTLKVYTSTDRKTWSEPTEIALTNEYVSQSLTALADGSYYVKFVSLNANIDNLTGLKKILNAPEHDLYVSTSNIPTATKVPETEITATATVHSLRADEMGVYAKLFFDETEVATAAAQDISLNGSANFTLTGNVPATENTYAAKIVVYYSDNSIAFETLTTDVTVQHTRQLAITGFVRDGEGDLSADVDNKVTAKFNVTVQNNSTCDLTADEVKVSIVDAAGNAYQVNETDNVTAATAPLPYVDDAETTEVDETTVVIPVTLTISAAEGGDFQFRAKELVSNTLTSEETPITIHVNAQAPQFGLKVKGGDALADGAAIDYGFIHSNEATTKQFTITNTGTKELVLTSIVAAEGFEATAVTEENKTIAVGGELDINVTLKANQGKKQGTIVISYDVNGTPTTFTLNVSGRSVSAATWVEDFTEGIPATWENTNNNWTVEEGMAYSGGINTERTLMTPRLAATAGEELTYDLTFRYTGYTVTVEYSNDNRTSWTQYAVVDDAHAGEQTFTAPADGNYYLRFTATRYAQLDNFVGFQLNIPQHDMEIVASTVPATGKQYNTYTATVTLKESAGKDENITANLYVDGQGFVNATADVTEIPANSTTVVTLTWEPQTTLENKNVYVIIDWAESDLQTDPVSLTISEVTTFDEDVNAAVAAITTPETVWLKHTLVSGWNTICLPFDVDYADIEGLFGNDAKVYDLKSYANNKLNFDCLTEGKMSGGTPYLIHVTSVTDIDQRVDNVTISSLNTTAGTSQSVFKGTYVPMTAGALEGKYGVTSDNKIAKGNSKTTMKGFRGYFEGISSMARISTFDETTGITNVYDYGEVFGKDDRVYNLNGQHVENAKKGVFIINGKKVVIK